MAYTELYCDPSSGDNLNAGDSTGAARYASGSGNWNSGTLVFTPTDSTNPVSSGVAAGQMATVWVNGSSAPTGYVARIATVVNATNGAITLDSTAKFGTPPTTSSGNMTIRVQGAWKGPNGSSTFPFGQITPALTNAAGNPPRVNLKNNASYTISAGIVATWSTVHGAMTFQGYTSTPGDGGRATIDGGGGAFDVISYTGSSGNQALVLQDLIVKNAGGTGAGIKLTSVSLDTVLVRIAVSGMSTYGFQTVTSSDLTFIECEAYSCNIGYFASGVFVRCNAHDNTSHGFQQHIGAFAFPIFIKCIAESNGGQGFAHSDNLGAMLIDCEAYNNSSDGLRVPTTSTFTYVIVAENCNFVKNGGYGINLSGTGGAIVGAYLNCGFGAGTQANSSGAHSTIPAAATFSDVIAGSATTVNYAVDVTPWVDPANGDFRINLAAAKGNGRCAFTQTAPSYAGTIGYPDIGAAQHQESVSAGMILSRVRSGF